MHYSINNYSYNYSSHILFIILLNGYLEVTDILSSGWSCFGVPALLQAQKGFIRLGKKRAICGNKTRIIKQMNIAPKNGKAPLNIVNMGTSLIIPERA